MATAKALILKQDGSVEEVTYEERDSLKTMQAAVGGLIESISGYVGNIDAYANEEGLYTEGLEVNPHMLVAVGVPIMGNIVFPRITDNKRKRLQNMGFTV